MRNITVGLLLVLLALTASAQNVVVGTQLLGGTLSRTGTPPYTLIDLSHPASADGTVTSASVKWNVRSCTGAFKLKFLRQSDPSSLTTFTLVAERGPFTAQAGRNLLAVSPPVDVKAGDLIAVTSLGSFATCGSPNTTLDTGSAVMRIAGDIQGGAFSGTYERGQALAARATDSAEVLEGVIAAAGSLQGNFGSFFRTSLQIASSGGGTSTGKIIFHPAGAPASSNDQAYPSTVSSGNAT